MLLIRGKKSLTLGAKKKTKKKREEGKSQKKKLSCAGWFFRDYKLLLLVAHITNTIYRLYTERLVTYSHAT